MRLKQNVERLQDTKNHLRSLELPNLLAANRLQIRIPRADQPGQQPNEWEVKTWKYCKRHLQCRRCQWWQVSQEPTRPGNPLQLLQVHKAILRGPQWPLGCRARNIWTKKLPLSSLRWGWAWLWKRWLRRPWQRVHRSQMQLLLLYRSIRDREWKQVSLPALLQFNDGKEKGCLSQVHRWTYMQPEDHKARTSSSQVPLGLRLVPLREARDHSQRSRCGRIQCRNKERPFKQTWKNRQQRRNEMAK